MATVDLNWTDNASSEDGFKVYRSDISTPAFPADYTEISDIATPDTTTYSDTGAPDGASLTYAVTAYNTDGESSETTASITTSSGVATISAETASISAVGLNSAFSPGPVSVASTTGTISTTGLSPSISEATASSDVTRGLVSKWKLDGDATDSYGTNDASTFYDVTWTTGYIDGAASLNSSTGGIEIPDDTSLDTNSFTVSAWVNLDSTSSGTSDIQVVTGKDNGYNDRMFWLVEWDGDWQARAGSNAATVNGGPAATGTWTHLALTYTGDTGEFNIYVDGTLKDTNTETVLDGDGANFTIGAETADNRVFGGDIDDVRFYNVELTSSEISDLSAYDGTSATPLSLTASVASMSGSGITPSFLPGSVSATGETVQANVVATSTSVSPLPVSVSVEAGGGSVAAPVPTASGGPVSVATDGGSVSAGIAAPTATPGPVSAGADLGTASVSGLSIQFTESGARIFADPAVLATFGIDPATTAGVVSVSSETAQVAASAPSASVVPIPIQVLGNVATGALVAQDSALEPGPISARAAVGSLSASLETHSLLAGTVPIAVEAGSLLIESPGVLFTPFGVIVADVASGDLSAQNGAFVSGPVAASVDSGSLGVSATNSTVSPQPVGISPAVVSQSVAVPGSTGFQLPVVGVGANVADLSTSSFGADLVGGPTGIVVDPFGLVVSSPGGLELTTESVGEVLALLGVVDYEHTAAALLAQDPEWLGRVNTQQRFKTVLRK